jgi:hypothetical protein
MVSGKGLSSKYSRLNLDIRHRVSESIGEILEVAEGTKRMLSEVKRVGLEVTQDPSKATAFVTQKSRALLSEIRELGSEIAHRPFNAPVAAVQFITDMAEGVLVRGVYPIAPVVCAYTLGLLKAPTAVELVLVGVMLAAIATLPEATRTARFTLQDTIDFGHG